MLTAGRPLRWALTHISSVSDFSIFPTLGYGGAQSADFGSNIDRKWGFSPIKFVRGHVDHPYRR